MAVRKALDESVGRVDSTCKVASFGDSVVYMVVGLIGASVDITLGILVGGCVGAAAFVMTVARA